MDDTLECDRCHDSTDIAVSIPMRICHDCATFYDVTIPYVPDLSGSVPIGMLSDGSVHISALPNGWVYLSSVYGPGFSLVMNPDETRELIGMLTDAVNQQDGVLCGRWRH